MSCKRCAVNRRSSRPNPSNRYWSNPFIVIRLLLTDNEILEDLIRQLLATPAGATTPVAERSAATWRAWMRKMLNIEMQIP